MAVTRRNLIGLAVADVALFVIANVAYNHHGLLRAISNIAWVAFLLGVVLLIVLGVRALAQSRRAR